MLDIKTIDSVSSLKDLDGFNPSNKGYTSIAKDLSTQARKCYQERKFDKALENYKKALEIFEVKLDPTHETIAKVYNNIGVTYRAKEEYAYSIVYFKKGLEIYEKLPDKIFEVGIITNEIAIAYKNQ